MEKENIVPNFLNKAPPEVLQIVYPSGKNVNLGEELTPTQVKDKPELKWLSETNSFYTLLMVDLDAPCRSFSIVSEVNHWLIGNICGNDLKTGETIVEYMGSGPPKYTGLHRYVFLLYKHEQKVNFAETKLTEAELFGRLRFNTKNFVKKYKLDEPVAANFFQAQWDEYVDVRNKENKSCAIL